MPKKSEIGLYYFTISVSSKTHLATVANHLINNRIKIISSLKHSAGYSIYLKDPENNGLQFSYNIPEINNYSKSEDFPLDEISSWSSCKICKNPLKGSDLINLHFNIQNLKDEINFYKEMFNLKPISKQSSAAYLSSDKKFPPICLNTWKKIKYPTKTKDCPGVFMYEISINKIILNQIIADYNTDILNTPSNILIKVV